MYFGKYYHQPTHACNQPSLIHTQHLKQERQYGATATYIIERNTGVSCLTHTQDPVNGTSNVERIYMYSSNPNVTIVVVSLAQRKYNKIETKEPTELSKHPVMVILIRWHSGVIIFQVVFRIVLCENQALCCNAGAEDDRGLILLLHICMFKV